jgi:hypothetical protein
VFAEFGKISLNETKCKKTILVATLGFLAPGTYKCLIYELQYQKNVAYIS